MYIYIYTHLNLLLCHRCLFGAAFYLVRWRQLLLIFLLLGTINYFFVLNICENNQNVK